MNDERSWKFSLYQEDNLKLSENELSFFLQSQGICELMPKLMRMPLWVREGWLLRGAWKVLIPFKIISHLVWEVFFLSIFFAELMFPFFVITRHHYFQWIDLETLGNMGSRCALSRHVCLTWFDRKLRYYFSLQPKGLGPWLLAQLHHTMHHDAHFLKGLKGGQVWIMSLFYFRRYFWFCDPSSDGTTDDVIKLLIWIQKT